MTKLTQKEIIKRLAKLRLKPLELYKNVRTKIKTKCLRCGHVWTTLVGSGCPRCASKQRADTQRLGQVEVRKRLNRAGVEAVESYKNVSAKIKVRCLTCGHAWGVLVSDLTRGSGCPKCAGLAKLSCGEARKRGLKLGIRLLEEYSNTRTKLKVECLACGFKWGTTLNRIQQGNGCPECRRTCPCVTEAKIRKIIEHITGWKFPKCKPQWLRGRRKRVLELDGYNEEHQVAFEYQGEQHYLPIYGRPHLEYMKKNDERKRVLCYQNGVVLIRIPYWKRNVEAFITYKLVKAHLIRLAK